LENSTVIPVSSISKTDCCDITEILLKIALKAHTVKHVFEEVTFGKK
jgi:hypothetical protein